MKIEPKYPNAEQKEFKLSMKARKILEHYSDYTGLTESQVLEEILPHLLNDNDFITHIDSKRSNTRVKRELGL
ncbi:hypothetical protein [Planococcus sp. 4-30]|uniref:hypothetical protein n=1 Tax=Planococcus sp. 4-30 TaxID=2874583 RepID=UPI001CBB6390|nr:hypothetical protein [Planococcus sp. 4-30]